MLLCRFIIDHCWFAPCRCSGFPDLRVRLVALCWEYWSRKATNVLRDLRTNFTILMVSRAPFGPYRALWDPIADVEKYWNKSDLGYDGVCRSMFTENYKKRKYQKLHRNILFHSGLVNWNFHFPKTNMSPLLVSRTSGNVKAPPNSLFMILNSKYQNELDNKPN